MSHPSENRARLSPPVVAAWAALGLAVIGAGALGSSVTGVAGTSALALHALLFVVAAALLARQLPPRFRLALLTAAAIATVAGAAIWTPSASDARRWLALGHVAAGVVAVSLLLASLLRWRGPIRAAVAALALAGVAAWTFHAQAAGSWRPPAYDAEACYRFLTATTAAQAGEPLFPSALRVREGGSDGCQGGGCHSDVHSEWETHGHSTASIAPAYRRILEEFEARRGEDAGRWCRGCHQPQALLPESPRSPKGKRGVACVGCHAVVDVHALYGGAALVLAPGPVVGQLERFLRPYSHSRQNLRLDLHRSAQLCAGCHRKSFSLPQNGYRFMPVVDEYGEWQSSRFSGAALFAAGGPQQPRTCIGCHDPHRGSASREPVDSGMKLELFLRRAGVADAEPASGPPAAAPGTPLLLDVVVANLGIGHDFPTGMPDLHESWVEVEVRDRAGRPVLRSGAVAEGQPLGDAHAYRLVALDRRAEPVRHGDLDRMVAVGERRRIPPGGADLARYRLVVPPSGIGSIRARLWRRRRPDFARWAGEPLRPPRLLAEAGTGDAPAPVTAAGRWRSYGVALAAAKAYPHAIRALERAQGDAETRIALGRVFLEEGDLLAAREQFRRAALLPGGRESAAAWEAAVLRQMGQSEQAVSALEPLSRRYPRDRRLRFELGKAYMDQLRNEPAAREFEALLAVDPLDVAAHYNLMLCLQRQNQLAQFRREETIYRLLAADPASPLPTGVSVRRFLEAQPLHEHPLEAVR